MLIPELYNKNYVITTTIYLMLKILYLMFLYIYFSTILKTENN